MRHRTLIVGAVLATGVFAALMFPVQVLEVSSRREGQVLWRTAVSTGDVVTFDYIHSIELTPVQGLFAVESDGWLRVVETRFPSYGAGLPVNVTGRSHDGWMVAAGGERMAEFSFYISPINRASLHAGGGTIDLSGRMDPGDVAVVAVGRRPFLLTRTGFD